MQISLGEVTHEAVDYTQIKPHLVNLSVMLADMVLWRNLIDLGMVSIKGVQDVCDHFLETSESRREVRS